MRVVPSRRGLAVTFAAFMVLGWGTGLVALRVWKFLHTEVRPLPPAGEAR